MTLINTLKILTEKIKEVYEKYPPEKITMQIYLLLVYYNGIDWQKYVKISKTYNREVIHSCDEFDLVIITWDSNHECPIHNHPKNGCHVKLLEGTITEERYDMETLEKIQTKEYMRDSIFYIDDSIAYHKMCNKNNHKCVSLHVYSPGKYKPKLFNTK